MVYHPERDFVARGWDAARGTVFENDNAGGALVCIPLRRDSAATGRGTARVVVVGRSRFVACSWWVLTCRSSFARPDSTLTRASLVLQVGLLDPY